MAAVATADLAQRIVVRLRTDVYDKLQRLSFRFFDDRDSSSIINRVAGDVQAVRSFIDGVLIKTLTVGISLAIYLGMGWCAIVAVKPLIANLPTGGLILMLAGGLTYSAGVAFYVRERLRYHHAIWHVFVLGGSVLHYFAILLYVIPGAPATAA